MVLVEVAFETFVYVEDIFEPGLDQHLAGFYRSFAASADQDDRRAPLIRIAHSATEQ